MGLIIIKFRRRVFSLKINIRVKSVCSSVFSLVLLVGIVVSAICDMAISGAFTWSLYPISSCIFGWLMFFPAIRFGLKGIPWSLAAYSLFVIPFLYALDRIIQVSNLILPVGIPMAAISIGYCWVVYVLFKVFKARMKLALALSFLLAIPVSVLVNVSLSKIMVQPIFDVWDLIGFFGIGIVAVFLLISDVTKQKKTV